THQCTISQHLSAIFIFLTVFTWLLNHTLDLRLLVAFSSTGFVGGCLIWELMGHFKSDAASSEHRARTVKASLLIFLTLITLMPILCTLTAPIDHYNEDYDDKDCNDHDGDDVTVEAWVAMTMTLAGRWALMSATPVATAANTTIITDGPPPLMATPPQATALAASTLGPLPVEYLKLGNGTWLSSPHSLLLQHASHLLSGTGHV
ncbi:hypothetical protein BJY52DRAFT_1359540, partial [Lactarius psammicola]